jgi:hypothetical protein
MGAIWRMGLQPKKPASNSSVLPPSYEALTEFPQGASVSPLSTEMTQGVGTQNISKGSAYIEAAVLAVQSGLPSFPGRENVSKQSRFPKVKFFPCSVLHPHPEFKAVCLTSLTSPGLPSASPSLQVSHAAVCAKNALPPATRPAGKCLLVPQSQMEGEHLRSRLTSQAEVVTLPEGFFGHSIILAYSHLLLLLPLLLGQACRPKHCNESCPTPQGWGCGGSGWSS